MDRFPTGESSPGGPSEPTLALQETTLCPNCENRHVGPYCNECGQRQLGRLTLWRLARKVAERVFEFERGFWPTVSGLTVDPGQVLRQYVGGKRRRYVNPASYFLVAAAGPESRYNGNRPPLPPIQNTVASPACSLRSSVPCRRAIRSYSSE